MIIAHLQVFRVELVAIKRWCFQWLEITCEQ